jgi:hypothetical protein
MSCTSTRKTLRALAEARRGVLVPGAFNALSARVIEDLGVTNMWFGLPDQGFMGLAEIADHTARIRDAVGLPLIVDADTGGSPRAANYFLNLVTDSPPIRHSCEKFVILFENLQRGVSIPKSLVICRSLGLQRCELSHIVSSGICLTFVSFFRNAATDSWVTYPIARGRGRRQSEGSVT